MTLTLEMRRQLVGRHVEHDPKSWDDPAAWADARKDTLHKHHGPVLNQLRLGSSPDAAYALHGVTS